MRMKRKKNLDERIAASSDYLITMKNDSLDFQDAIKENHLLDFNKVFKKEHHCSPLEFRNNSSTTIS